MEFSIFWASALSMELFEQACLDVKRTLKTFQIAGEEEDTKELVRRHMSAGRTAKWLLLVDNADRDVVIGNGQWKGVIDYLPQSKRGVIFTTHAREVAMSLARTERAKAWTNGATRRAVLHGDVPHEVFPRQCDHKRAA